MKIPYKIINDLIQHACKLDHEIGGCFNFSNGKYTGYTLMRGTQNFIEIPLDNCTISFHSHPPQGGHLGYKLDPPSPGDMKETIGQGRNYILLTKEGVYEYGAISSEFRDCNYLPLYELIHTNKQISAKEERNLLQCIRYHHGSRECEEIEERLSLLSGDIQDYIFFVDYIFRLMGSFLLFYPYPLKEDLHLSEVVSADRDG